MTIETLVALTILVGVVAFLYSSVGHAGASGYIAVMTILGLSPAFIRPTALALNILVATITFFHFFRAGHFSWKLFWPFAILAIPMAYVGGNLALPADWFKKVVGIVLLFSSYRLLIRSKEEMPSQPCPNIWAIPLGGFLGLIAGLTGTGGGIFLTPLLLWKRWSGVKEAAAASSLFILCNSVAGLVGNVVSTRTFPTTAIPVALAAILGGSAGSYLGSSKLPIATIKKILAIVLIIAGLKLTLNW